MLEWKQKLLYDDIIFILLAVVLEIQEAKRLREIPAISARIIFPKGN